MKHVRMKVGALVGDAFLSTGDVLQVDDHTAARLAGHGHAEILAAIEVDEIEADEIDDPDESEPPAESSVETATEPRRARAVRPRR